MRAGAVIAELDDGAVAAALDKARADLAAEGGRRVPVTVSMGARMHDELAPLAANFDHVVIDCPPRVDGVQRSAIMAADVCVLPTGPSPADVWALGATIELVQAALTIRPALLARVLLTRMLPRTHLGKTARDTLAAGGLPILSSALAFRVSYQEALATGQPVTTYEPTGSAAHEVRALVDELLDLVEVRRAKAASNV